MKPFAEACIRNTAWRLSGVRGGRNQALFNAACALGKYVHNGIVTEYDVRSALMTAARTNGYAAKDGEHRAQDTITSGIAKARNDRLPDLDALSAGCPRRYRH